MTQKNNGHVDQSKNQEIIGVKPPINERPKKGPIGLDVGTANIVVAQSNGNGNVNTVSEINAFFTVPTLPTTRKILEKKDIMFFEIGEYLYILGNSAQNFANILGSSTKRPIENGLLNLKENEGISVIKSLLNKLIKQSEQKGTKVIFSIPGDPIDSDESVVSNETIFKTHLQSLGYTPEPINEGLAVILSELSDDSATGIGISMGGGMCNICLSYLSIPVLTYSIQKGGDYIDKMVGNSVGEPATKIKSIKEEDFDLTREPKNSIETGLHIYYDALFSILIKSLHQTLKTSDEVPRLPHAIPIILSGGTVLPKGCKEKFEKGFRDIQLPLTISDIVIAKDPLTATAKGALTMALS
ncbi:MAG: hypothetical protein DRP08_08155 [Candidatus Aenigmatarchaeota archaeon]|nr:MAG: hypothetical protein DRP08_08155 [Candidatus Aenigmarchaeota archaeon]